MHGDEGQAGLNGNGMRTADDTLPELASPLPHPAAGEQGSSGAGAWTANGRVFSPVAGGEQASTSVGVPSLEQLGLMGQPMFAFGGAPGRPESPPEAPHTATPPERSSNGGLHHAAAAPGSERAAAEERMRQDRPEAAEGRGRQHEESQAAAEDGTPQNTPQDRASPQEGGRHDRSVDRTRREAPQNRESPRDGGRWDRSSDERRRRESPRDRMSPHDRGRRDRASDERRRRESPRERASPQDRGRRDRSADDYRRRESPRDRMSPQDRGRRDRSSDDRRRRESPRSRGVEHGRRDRSSGERSRPRTPEERSRRDGAQDGGWRSKSGTPSLGGLLLHNPHPHRRHPAGNGGPDGARHAPARTPEPARAREPNGAARRADAGRQPEESALRERRNGADEVIPQARRAAPDVEQELRRAALLRAAHARTDAPATPGGGNAAADAPHRREARPEQPRSGAQEGTPSQQGGKRRDRGEGHAEPEEAAHKRMRLSRRADVPADAEGDPQGKLPGRRTPEGAPRGPKGVDGRPRTSRWGAREEGRGDPEVPPARAFVQRPEFARLEPGVRAALAALVDARLLRPGGLDADCIRDLARLPPEQQEEV